MDRLLLLFCFDGGVGGDIFSGVGGCGATLLFNVVDLL
jgi:hypothetical protein